MSYRQDDDFTSENLNLKKNSFIKYEKVSLHFTDVISLMSF